ncbi:MAG: sigma 54-interacting transcriptional regulator [Planctomycetota bacterium]|nr:sigma 54-interacting transcriptional regulator [Planctomycetota bacterium]
MRSLITFIGNSDPETPYGEGPILAACRHYEIDRTFVFFNSEVKKNADALKKMAAGGETLGSFHFVDMGDVDVVSTVKLKTFVYNWYQEKREKLVGDDIYVNTTSGTPSMTAALLFLTVSRDLPAIPLLVRHPAKLKGVDERIEVLPVEGEGVSYVHPMRSKQYVRSLHGESEISEVAKKNKIIGESPKLKECIENAIKYASVDKPILIAGESGVGKESIAKVLHEESKRNGKDFLSLNSSTIDNELANSTLFGHAKGSFSGALHDYPGAIGNTEGGTLFLDEIHHMPRPVQAKILRVVQQGTYIPVGSTEEKKADVRFVFATNVDLREMVANGEFLSDLFARIEGFKISLPPLRARKGDIPLLARHFHDKFWSEEKEDTSPPPLSSDVLHEFMKYDWPGNIRELQLVVQNLLTLGTNEGITLEAAIEKMAEKRNRNLKDFYDKLPLTPQGMRLKDFVKNIKHHIMLNARKSYPTAKDAAEAIGVGKSEFSSPEYKAFEAEQST